MAFPDWAAGETITAGKLNSRERHFARVDSEETVNASTTLTASTQLTFEAEADAIYELLVSLRYSTPDAADFKWDYSVPSGATMTRFPIAADLTSSDRENSNVRLLTAAESTAAQAGGDAGNILLLREHAWLETGGTSGTVSLRFAQVVSTGSDTILRSFSFMTWQRVS
jgi:hypothetical protein